MKKAILLVGLLVLGFLVNVSAIPSSQLGYYYIAETEKCFSEPFMELNPEIEGPYWWDARGECEQLETECCSQICETYDESTHHCELRDEYKDEVLQGLVERTKSLNAKNKNLHESNAQTAAALGAILILSIILNAYLAAKQRKKK